MTSDEDFMTKRKAEHAKALRRLAEQWVIVAEAENALRVERAALRALEDDAGRISLAAALNVPRVVMVDHSSGPVAVLVSRETVRDLAYAEAEMNPDA